MVTYMIGLRLGFGLCPVAYGLAYSGQMNKGEFTIWNVGMETYMIGMGLGFGLGPVAYGWVYSGVVGLSLVNFGLGWVRMQGWVG